MSWVGALSETTPSPSFNIHPPLFLRVIPFEKLALTLFTHQSGQAEDISLGTENVCVYPSYNTHLSIVVVALLVGLTCRL